MRRYVIVIGLGFLVACGSALPAGAERGACYGNGSCNAGLTCLSDRCVRPAAPSVAATPARDLVEECRQIYAHMSKVLKSEIRFDGHARHACLAEQITTAQRDCLMAAGSMDEISVCMPSKKKPDEMASDTGEARHNLHQLYNGAKTYFEVNNGAFPKGDTGFVPGPPECADGHKKAHAPSAADWSSPIWTALAFSISDPFYYSYRYESNGKWFTITAQGDLDCNGRISTFTQKGMIGQDGAFQGGEIETDSSEQ